VNWHVVVRNGPRVERHRAASLEEALDVLETEARVASNTERRGDLDARFRTFSPAEQVAARVELRRPRAGFDVRGDGTVQAWTGRIRRRLIEPRGDETVYEALRRSVAP
jgi:hypothetical protein